MSINTDKTQVLTISSSPIPARSKLISNGNTIPPNKTLKMLGFEFHEKPTVHHQIDALVKKANKRLFMLLNFTKGMVYVMKSS